MKVKLTRITSNHQNLRSDEIVGELVQPFCLGECVILVGEAFDEEMRANGGQRMVHTTPVIELTSVGTDIWDFKTRNSHYRLEKIV